MALLQISEPGQSPEPHANDKKRALGIDLGTSNSLVATMQNDEPVTLPDEQGEHLLPSVVQYGDEVRVGRVLRFQQIYFLNWLSGERKS